MKPLEHCEFCDRPIGAVGKGTRTRSGIGPICEECLKELFDTGLTHLGSQALTEFCLSQFEEHSAR